MGDAKEMKPVICGCGGEAKVQRVRTWKSHLLVVMCTKCEIATNYYTTETEAIEAWNRAMGIAKKSSTVERTAKVDWINGEPFCPMCGDRLEWE